MPLHLWRSYPEPPYDRYACTVQFDPEAEDGFKIVEFDSHIADAKFLHALADHMRRPVPVQSGELVDGAIREGLDWKHAGSEDHFEGAARMFPMATVFGKGRPAA